MEDNTPQDSALRIDLMRETDVNYWCRILDVSPEELRHAVQHAGHQVADVRHYLQGQA